MSFSYSQFPEIDFPYSDFWGKLKPRWVSPLLVLTLLWLYIVLLQSQTSCKCTITLASFKMVENVTILQDGFLFLWITRNRFSWPRRTQSTLSQCHRPHIFHNENYQLSTMANLWCVPVNIWKRGNISPGKSVKIIRAVSSTETQTHKRQPLIVSPKS